VERFVVAVALVAVVAVVALVVSRRRGLDAPSQPKRWPVPAQLDRDDFTGGDQAWLAALFTSATCQSCARLEAIVAPLASQHVAVAVLPWQEHKAVHDRYGIEAVPCFVLADGEGVVRYSIVGSDVTATDLWAGVAEARDPNPPQLPGEGDRHDHPSPGSSGG
jgi:hypothetical protein